MRFDIAPIVIWIFELPLDQEIRAVGVIRILLGLEHGLVVVAIAEPSEWIQECCRRSTNSRRARFRRLSVSRSMSLSPPRAEQRQPAARPPVNSPSARFLTPGCRLSAERVICLSPLGRTNPPINSNQTLAIATWRMGRAFIDPGCALLRRYPSWHCRHCDARPCDRDIGRKRL